MKINKESIKLVNRLYGRKNLETKINGDFGYIDRISFVNKPNYKKSPLWLCYNRYSKAKEHIYTRCVDEALYFNSYDYGIVSFNAFKFTFAYDFIYRLHDIDGRKHSYKATFLITDTKKELWLEESNIL